MASANYSHCVPVLPVADIATALSFYQNQLGFTNQEWDGISSVARVGRDGMNIYFRQVEGPMNPMEAFLFVSNAEEVYKDMLHRGVSMAEVSARSSLGSRAFVIHDLNGHVLHVGEGIETESDSLIQSFQIH